MPRSHPPWWLYLAGASFAGYFVFIAVSNNFPPEGFGAVLEAQADGIVVKAVSPGSPAEAGGVRPGDRQVSFDGLPLRNNFDLQAALGQLAVGTPATLEFARAGRRFTVTHTPTRRVFVGVSGRDLSPRLYPTVTFALFFTLVMGLALAFRHHRDPNALLGAWLLASVACATAPLWMRGTAATLRALPLPVGALLWPACLSSMATGALALAFFWTFPRPRFASWRLWLAFVPAAIVLAWVSVYLVLITYSPASGFGFPSTRWAERAAVLSFPAYLAAAAVVMGWRYRVSTDLNERRRMRVLIAGAAAGAAGLLMLAVSQTFTTLPTAPAVVLFMLLPASFAYAIARHRLFDLRLMIRRGMQYALARGVVVSVVPAIGLALVFDLLWHGDEPLFAVIMARGWIYFLLVVLARLAFMYRTRWLEALDRRFFRERYNAQRVLREVVEDMRHAGSVEEAAPTVVARIVAALHPEFAAVLARDANEASYRTLAIAPEERTLPPLAGDSKLVGLVRLLGRPLQLGTQETGWLSQQLPHDETGFVRSARLDLLMPIAVGAGGREALLVLGHKRSEEPYGAEDLELLAAIAVSLGLLLERPAPEPRVTAAFGECPQCGRCFDTSVSRCVDDGSALATSRFDRTVAGRYRLERRLGRGGMGTVYEAADSALERRVAVKLIREDLVGNTDAAGRFRREARAAAGFAHPHVVTVHDFGVTDDGRAFLIMERLEGRTLRDALRRDGRLTLVRTRGILRAIGDAVDAAHRRQIIHRDLKPENVFLASQGAREIAKVLDFGIAKFLPSSAAQTTAETGSGALLGTVRYMAPEQLDGGVPTPLWDLWALALVTYEMLAGTHPFDGVHPAGWRAAQQAGGWTPLGERLPDAPPDLQAFFRRALAADPTGRPQSAASFVEQFEASSAPAAPPHT